MFKSAIFPKNQVLSLLVAVSSTYRKGYDFVDPQSGALKADQDLSAKCLVYFVTTPNKLTWLLSSIKSPKDKNYPTF